MHAALREAREEVGIDADKIEIQGRLGPPTRSLSGLGVWPYVVSSGKSTLTLPSNNSGVEAFLHEKPYEKTSDIDDT